MLAELLRQRLYQVLLTGCLEELHNNSTKTNISVPTQNFTGTHNLLFHVVSVSPNNLLLIFSRSETAQESVITQTSCKTNCGRLGCGWTLSAN